MRRKGMIVLTVLAVLFASLPMLSGYAASPKNSVCVLGWGSWAVSDGKYIFYSDDDGRLCREDIDTEEQKIITETDGGARCLSITVFDEWVYFCRNGRIYRVQKEGRSVEEEIARCGLSTCIAIQDGYLFYADTKKFYKCNLTNLKDQEELINNDKGYFTLFNDRIYFNNTDKSLGSVGLASVNFDGEDFETYLEGEVKIIGCYKGRLYYIREDEEIWVLSKDGEAKQIYQYTGLGYYPIIYEDYIYFEGKFDSNLLSRVSINGGERETGVLNSVSTYICIAEDKIYTGGTTLYAAQILPSFHPEESDEPEPTTAPKPSSTSKPTATKRPDATQKPSSTYQPDCSSWAKEELLEADEEGLIPEIMREEDLTRVIDRAEFASIAVELYQTWKNQTVTAPNRVPFTDIGRGDYETYIKKAYKLELTNGMTPTTFEPERNISREQLATMLARTVKAVKYPGYTIAEDSQYYFGTWKVKKFDDDAQISDYARDSVYFLADRGVIKGTSEHPYLFSPQGASSLGDAYGAVQGAMDAFATREQAIIMSLRIFKDKEDILDEVYGG